MGNENRRLKRPTLLMALFLLFLLAGSVFISRISSTQETQTRTQASPVSSPATTQSEEPHEDYEEPAAPIPEREIEMRGNAFDPEVITVKVGERIVFENRDTDVHTATAEDTGILFFDTEDLQPGEERLIGSYNTPGTYEYYCKYHPEMHGTIIVEE